MKLLDLDSSLSARKELARELQYAGDMNDLASMNVWLHKQVMRKLAENGGKTAELTQPKETPTESQPSRPLAGNALVKDIKKELKRVGCYTGAIDGKWTTAGSSIKKFVRAAHMSAAPEPTTNLLNMLRMATSSSTRRMLGRIEETAASFEARSAPRSYPTV